MNKANFLYKIRCPDPEHEDESPSTALYSDGTAYCFVCNKYFKDIAEPIPTSIKPIEDLHEKLIQISKLPTTEIRGLILPFDNSGYYIVWPTGDYYKLRRWGNHSDRERYLSPSGHRKPLFKLPEKVTPSLLIVEGELNALSIALHNPAFDIISPGGVGNFNDSQMLLTLPSLAYYANILIIADADTQGLEASLKLKEKLKQLPSRVTINLVEKDFNQVLVEYGDKFKEQTETEFKDLGMPTWLHTKEGSV